EGPILALVERWRSEPVSAQWWQGTPSTLTCYGPGYYWLVKVVSPLTPWDHTLIPGRLLALAAMLATALLFALLIYRPTHSVEVSLAGALFYLAAPVVTYWLPYHRVDTLAIFLSLASYAVLGRSRASGWASALLVVAGSLVKQTAALSALPVILYLW